MMTSEEIWQAVKRTTSIESPIVRICKEELVQLSLKELRMKEKEAWAYWKRINRTIEFLESD
tara:strand:+ start:106 stop:291 length:186 start_codon:yes stop_codon:yes gene_type:complete